MAEAAQMTDKLWAALHDVVDPEIPTVSVVDMGMVHRIEAADDGTVAVEMLPTFSGCPALDVIRRHVSERLAQEPGVTGVEVRFVREPIWSTDRITAQGQARLMGFGIAPAPLARGRTLTVLQAQQVTCPLCGSTRTVMDNLFGPTPCRSIYRCLDCRNPFERFKAV